MLCVRFAKIGYAKDTMCVSVKHAVISAPVCHWFCTVGSVSAYFSVHSIAGCVHTTC